MSVLGKGEADAFHGIVWPITLSLRVPGTVGQSHTCLVAPSSQVLLGGSQKIDLLQKLVGWEKIVWFK
ncbi:hypothetical protein BJP34_32920 [Moorena producens PAL-8-15-08-1]|uniref:Uncharacterized protein n=1 Tax=Moorena producens PAL-8-15-08-1 TaxID=1458985 RepID=A0A1D8U175_9CYAN|nr:hypothetical protein [Moorena producens]AOX03595.1 hypothetical protein BJP34_32920 [Moorena producens PAL-8-15-08-1]